MIAAPELIREAKDRVAIGITISTPDGLQLTTWVTPALLEDVDTETAPVIGRVLARQLVREMNRAYVEHKGESPLWLQRVLKEVTK